MSNPISFKSDRVSMLKALRSLEIGHKLVIPIEQRATIRTYCCQFGLEWKRKFVTKTEREIRAVIVTREA